MSLKIKQSEGPCVRAEVGLGYSLCNAGGPEELIFSACLTIPWSSPFYNVHSQTTT